MAAQAPKVSRLSQSPNAIRDYIRVINTTEPERSAHMGVMAMTFAGDTLVAYNPYHKLLPASNTKLISTGLALNELGADYKFSTSIGYSGTIQDGVLNGDLYIIGGGDPTLASKDSITTYIDGFFAKWYTAMKDAGIRRISGHIIGDGRFFDGPIESDSWEYSDLGTYYGTGGDGLCFYRNTQDIKVQAGAKVGDPVKWEVDYPQTPWMRYYFPCTTGRKGSGDNLYLYTTDLSTIAEMRGSFAIDRAPTKEECSNKYGARTCAHYFGEYLRKYSVVAEKGIADIDSEGYIREDLLLRTRAGKAVPQEDLTVLTTTYSPTLKKIAKMTNWRSDNFYAETLLRILSRERTGSACYDSCQVAETRAIEKIGVDPSYGAHIVDGSGLARNNYISPDFFCRYLRAMMNTDVFEDFVGTLQQPGQGSYSARLQNDPISVKSRIYMKSGSMGGVRCFSGYIVPSDGGKEDTIVFSVLVNNYTGPSWKIMGQIDRIIAMLAGMN